MQLNAFILLLVCPLFTVITRLLNNQLEDDTFTSLGLSYLSDVLAKIDDANLVLNYAPNVLSRDATIGVQVRS